MPGIPGHPAFSPGSENGHNLVVSWLWAMSGIRNARLVTSALIVNLEGVRAMFPGLMQER